MERTFSFFVGLNPRLSGCSGDLLLGVAGPSLMIDDLKSSPTDFSFSSDPNGPLLPAMALSAMLLSPLQTFPVLAGNSSPPPPLRCTCSSCCSLSRRRSVGGRVQSILHLLLVFLWCAKPTFTFSSPPMSFAAPKPRFFPITSRKAVPAVSISSSLCGTLFGFLGAGFSALSDSGEAPGAGLISAGVSFVLLPAKLSILMLLVLFTFGTRICFTPLRLAASLTRSVLMALGSAFFLRLTRSSSSPMLPRRVREKSH
mmetsp:Transcript_25847/g.76402  ORF Transcript_25847/g.76402 Transcript_25847/m.76402 type:complete len:256 (+) Transcript_25847:5378-6145(+)